MRQRGAAWARFALALVTLVTLVACRAAEPISIEQRWLRGEDDENRPPDEGFVLAGSENELQQSLFLAPWDSRSELYLFSHERDPASGAWVESWLDFDVGRKVVDWDLTTTNDIFVLSDAGNAEFVIDRFRVTPPAGGYRAVRPRGGPTKYELIGDRFTPPLERDKATIERFEIARIQGAVVAIAAEPNARSLLALVRREQGRSQVLQVDVASGATTVLTDSSRFPLLASAGNFVKSNHTRHGFIVVQLLDGGRWYVPHKLVFLDRDRDGDFDAVEQLTDDEFEAAGYLDSAQLIDD